MRWPTALLLLVCAAPACRSASPATPSAVPNLTGTWAGDLTLQGETTRMRWELTETNGAVHGPVLVSEPNGVVLLNGTLTGTLSGSSLTYTIAVAQGGIPLQPACTGQIGGMATVAFGATATLGGTYDLVSSTCPTPFSSGSFTLAEQSR